jgi:hypothetical protein
MPTSTKALPNEYGVTWHASRSGRLQIALAPRNRTHGPGGPGWDVWTLRTGTHDLTPHGGKFATEAEARRHANQVWRNH